MTTFADVPVGAWFYMNAGGTESLCQKATETSLKIRKVNGEWMETKASPLWDITTMREVDKQREADYDRRNRPPARGHSSTYPYGEH